MKKRQKPKPIVYRTSGTKSARASSEGKSFPVVGIGASAGGLEAATRRAAAPLGRQRRPACVDVLRRRVADLERELSETRAQLQMFRDKQEADKEELQSTNRELEASKEELGSSNAKLMTLNKEIANRNLELSRLNNDLDNLHLSINTYIARFEGLVGSVTDAVICIDTPGRILLFNPAAERMFGVSAQQAVGQSIDQFIAGNLPFGSAGRDKKSTKSVIAVSRREPLGIITGLRATGEQFSIEASISQLEVGGETLSTIILRDLTERHQAMEVLRASHEELRALAAHLQKVREEERTRAAREIHDVLAQELTSIKMELAWLRPRLSEPGTPRDQKVVEKKVGALMDLTDKASQSVQRIATELRPVVLDKLGLCAATQWVAADFQKRTKISCEANVPNHDLALDRDHSTALFRILQESLTNVARHAQATKVEIQLRREVGELLLTVHDNGRGIQSAELKDLRSVGLLGMRERASLLGGTCTITGQAGVGTRVEVRVPTVLITNPRAKP